MRKIIKRTLCVLSATMCVLGTAVTASADTVSAYISSGSRASSASYTSYAAPNYTYEMYATSSTSGLNVTGRFTP